MFMDTFTKVGEEFRTHFKMLFGGGEAELVLPDPENVLESGIDIIARHRERSAEYQSAFRRREDLDGHCPDLRCL